nr:hypothetical protein [Tanacetum cinerariifolium]
MEEMLYKFIDEGKSKQEEMRAFIHKFRTTNELLFKESNNSLSELRFEVQGLLRVINNSPISNMEVKGVTTIGHKTTTQDVQDNDTNIHTKEPLVINHDEPVESNKVLTKDQPQKTNELVVWQSSGVNPIPKRNSQNVLIKVDKSVLPIDFVILDMLEDSRFLIILERTFLATAQALIDVFNKKITLRVGDDEVIYDMEQSIKKSRAEDDECYGANDLDDTINTEARELLANDTSDSFLLKRLEKSIEQSDLESYEFSEYKAVDGSNLGEPI